MYVRTYTPDYILVANLTNEKMIMMATRSFFLKNPHDHFNRGKLVKVSGCYLSSSSPIDDKHI